jgi:hypothetical protein
VGLDPFADLDGVEAEEVAPLVERDASFGDEAADVAFGDAEHLGDGGEVDEGGSGGGLVGRGHRGRSPGR